MDKITYGLLACLVIGSIVVLWWSLRRRISLIESIQQKKIERKIVIKDMVASGVTFALLIPMFGALLIAAIAFVSLKIAEPGLSIISVQAIQFSVLLSFAYGFFPALMAGLHVGILKPKLQLGSKRILKTVCLSIAWGAALFIALALFVTGYNLIIGDKLQLFGTLLILLIVMLYMAITSNITAAIYWYIVDRKSRAVNKATN